MRALVAAVAALVATALLPGTAAACLATMSPSEQIALSDVVITGVAVDRRPGDPISTVVGVVTGDDTQFGVVEYLIEVDAVEPDRSAWGAWSGRVAVHVDGFSSCAQYLELGQRYRLGAVADGGRLFIPFGAIEAMPLRDGPQPAVSILPSRLRAPIQVALVGSLLFLTWRRLRHRPVSTAA